MQIPYRKPGKFSQMKIDPLVTEKKYQELNAKLEKLKNMSQPQAAAEVARLAELGDFSENAEYQIAKGRLRGINNSILRLEHQLHQAIIIRPLKQTDTVKIGHTVTVERNGKQNTYQLLGSSETDPQKGIISHNSPLGGALMGRMVGEIIAVKLADKEVDYKIVKIK